MNIFESKSSSNNYAISVSSAENDLAIKQINEIKNDDFQIDNYVHINNMGVNSKSLLAIKSEMPNATANNRSKLDEYERSLNDNSYAENIGADESNEKNIEAKHLINNNDNIDMNDRQSNDDIAQKSSFKTNHKSEHLKKNENFSNQDKEQPKVDLENIEKQNLIESKTNDSDTTTFNKFNKNSSNTTTKMLKPSNEHKHKRKSKSASSFIRRLFTCGVTSSCAGRRNSSKSSSSCHGSDRAIHNSNNAINLKSNSNNGISHNLNNNNNKPEAQIFSSNESIRNKFDGIKKYALASIKPKSNDSIANKKIDAMKLNEKRDSVVNKTVLNSSSKSGDDQYYDAKKDISEKLNDTNTNESSSKLVVPILKINDDIITAGQEEYVLDNEETEDMVEESIEDEAEDDDENDDLEEGDDDEDVELVDEDDEDELNDEAKLLGRGTRDEYEYDEENEENNYDDYEDEDEDDEEEEMSNHHKYFNINAAKKSSQHNSTIKQSSSASPVVKLNTSASPTASKINNHKIPSFSFDSEDKDLNQSGCMDTQSQMQLDQQANNNNPSVTDFYSKFLTANNIITDRGIVNIRTGSFNLGCQPADQLKLSNDELTDSNEFFSRLNDSQNEFIRSSSNYSFRTAYNNSNSNNNSSDYFKSSFGGIKGDSFGGASNLLVPLMLVANRRKNSTVSINSKNEDSCETPKKPSIQLSPSDYELINSSANATPTNQSSTLGNKTSLNANSLVPSTSINNGLLPTPNLPGEQERRCSHDPNIEKLHKTYINNVKLGGTAVVSSASVSTTNTDSTSNILNSALTNLDSPPASKLTSIRYTLNNIKKSKNSQSNSNSKSNNRNYIKLSNSINAAKNVVKNQSINSNDPIDSDKLELESSEKSDVLNEINKVNKWLRDTKNHHSKSPSSAAAKEHKKMAKIPPSMTISEDEDNYTINERNVDGINNKIAGLSLYSYDDEDNETENTNEAKTKHSYETTDSAIDIRSYGSISTLSKTSSINSRVNWQSFSKYYRLQFYQHMDTTWTKYQISAMSLEQLMALRKLALIQFSKLVERQHSTMIRKFRLFTKKTSTASEFQKAYDSIDSINTSKPNASSKSENASSGLNASVNGKNGENVNTQASVIIGNRKISHQLGAHIGMHPNVANRKRRKTSLKKLEKQLYYESKRDTPMAISVDESSSEIRDTSEISIANSTYANSNANSSVNSNQNAAICVSENAKAKISTNVFALPLSKIMQHTGQPLPQRIIEAMRFLRRIAPNEVGVFRKNGNKARINKLKESINKNEPINFQSEDITVFDIADTIKLYFRELPECLITNKLSDILLSNYTSMALTYFFFIFSVVDFFFIVFIRLNSMLLLLRM